MKVALITGANGQDGTYLFNFLHGHGYDCIYKYTGNVLDIGDIQRTLKNFAYADRIEIYNLAAKIDVGISIPNPIESFHVNSMGILTILESVKELDLIDKCRIFHASSSEVFDKSLLCHDTITHQDENTKRDSKTIYGLSKITADNILKTYREVYGLNVYSGILFNHESPLRKDKFVTTKIINGLKSVFKGEIEYIELGNINVYRDWGHAKDFVEAMWLILQSDTPDDYVIATGKYNTVRKFIEITVDVMGKKINWEGEGVDEIGIVDGKTVIRISEEFYRPYDKNLVGNPYKLKLETGWNPIYNLRDIIVDMIK